MKSTEFMSSTVFKEIQHNLKELEGNLREFYGNQIVQENSIEINGT